MKMWQLAIAVSSGSVLVIYAIAELPKNLDASLVARDPISECAGAVSELRDPYLYKSMRVPSQIRAANDNTGAGCASGSSCVEGTFCRDASGRELDCLNGVYQ